MSSAFRDKTTPGAWIADFRPFAARGSRRRRVRIPPARCRTETDARAYAAECDRYCRLLETCAPAGPADIRHALRLKAITAEEADRLAGDPTGRLLAHSRPTIDQAHDLHPSTHRTLSARSRDYDRCQSAIDRFRRFAGVTYIDQVTVQLVQRYLDHLRAAGLSWDTRRHLLLPIRRACRMAPSLGHADPLAGLLLDRRDEAPEIPVWTLPELCHAAIAFQAISSPLPLATLALGGFLGLRPSEICRALVSDIVPLTAVPAPIGPMSPICPILLLQVGLRARKNAQSRRDLPIPPIVADWLAPLITGRQPAAPLIPRQCPCSLHSSPFTLHPSKRRGASLPFDAYALSKWFTPLMTAAIPDAARHPIKALRKSFATWAINSGIDERHVEAYLGHLSSRVAAVTSRHYLAAARARELLPAAMSMDATLRAALASISAI